ncbi:hypothetical protein OG339_24250 [Streptosporangium sp. NBC_01495]|uniref:hypothetical protein n=1 Tax=Streptosporangium sp. NBC_01495 TaxID=2903899 RepID=UPI002E35502D|nr:hypothetical protein [Streptosporangium sp. NBC_01495]
MVSPLHVGIAGTHGTDTTTLARRIEMELRATGLSVARIGGLARQAAGRGFPKMTRHTTASTEWIITYGAAAALEAELTADVVIVDGTAHTALAYYLAALRHHGRQPSPDDLDHLTALVRLHTRRQVLIMATVLDPAAPFEADLGKDSDYPDAAFRAVVDQQFHRLLTDQRPDYLAVFPLDPAPAVHVAVTAIMERLDTP